MKHLRRSIVIGIMALVAMNFPASIFGQTTLAIQGGLSRATVGGSDAENVDARIGITLGASATIPIQEKFSLQFGGNYVQKGAKTEEESLSTLVAGAQVAFFLQSNAMSGPYVLGQGSLQPRDRAEGESDSNISCFGAGHQGYSIRKCVGPAVFRIEGRYRRWVKHGGANEIMLF